MKKIAIFLIVLMNLVYTMEYEVIKNNYANKDIVTIYLDNKECYSLLGNEFSDLKRAYSFISQMMLYSNLGHDYRKIKLTKASANSYEITWDSIKILKVSSAEKVLNDKRGNNINKIKKIIENNSLFNEEVQLNKNTAKYSKIKKVKLVQIDSFKQNQYFPAIHPTLPIGTKIRVLNPKNHWSVIVKVVDNKDLGEDDLIGINKLASNALNINNSNKVKVQFL